MSRGPLEIVRDDGSAPGAPGAPRTARPARGPSSDSGRSGAGGSRPSARRSRPRRRRGRAVRWASVRARRSRTRRGWRRAAAAPVAETPLQAASDASPLAEPHEPPGEPRESPPPSTDARSRTREGKQDPEERRPPALPLGRVDLEVDRISRAAAKAGIRARREVEVGADVRCVAHVAGDEVVEDLRRLPSMRTREPEDEGDDEGGEPPEQEPDEVRDARSSRKKTVSRLRSRSSSSTSRRIGRGGEAATRSFWTKPRCARCARSGLV